MNEPLAMPSNFKPAWRQRPLARAIALASCWAVVATQAELVYAAPPAANALPRAAQAWLTQGEARLNTVGNTMTIDQSSAKAILNWESFNIGEKGKVQFNQPTVNSTALNVIKDASATQIFGQLSANGNIYLVNSNGILFGQGAQVNVHGLVATTLNIDTDQFVNSSLPGSINSGRAALEGGSADNAVVAVDRGAHITTDEGGQVLMFAPNVLNAGEISTPGGQTILAAGKDKVYLAASDNNPDLRGLLVEVDSGGNVANIGKIVAERGNITLLGLAVNQGEGGVLRATTSVDVNGSIRLLARDKAVLKNDPVAIRQSLLKDDKEQMPTGVQQAVATEGGTIVLQKGSVTEVVADLPPETPANLPEKTAADAQRQDKSRIDLVGKNIDLLEGSTIRAKSGKVNLVATATPDNLDDKAVARNGSRIYLGANSTIDVSGEKIELDMSRRIVEVELRGDELKDSPLQRNGALHGKKVYVDIDKGSPLVSDLKPTLAKIQRGVQERMTAGGTIDMASQGGVLVAGKVQLNISGGSTTYKSGYVSTSKLMSNGRIFDIGSADPKRKYDGILGSYTDVHPKWGKTFYSSKSFATYREGFTEGSSAGALNIDTQTMYGFDHVDLQAGADIGRFQRAGGKQPTGGAVSIQLGQGPAAAFNSIQDVLIGNIAGSVLDPLFGVYGNDEIGFAQLQISAEQLNRSGLGSFSLAAHGAINQAADSSIALKPGAELSLRGTGVEIHGRIRTPGGKIELAATAPRDDGDHTQEHFNLLVAGGSLLDASGNWVNDLKDLRSGGALAATALDGGTIDLAARNDLTIEGGSVLRADAGAQFTSAGAFVGGNGGTIALSSEEVGSALTIGGSLSAYGFDTGGTLDITAASIDVGSRPASADSSALWLDAGFLAGNGFGQYNLSAGKGELVVHSDASLQLRQQNLQLSDKQRAAGQATGGDVRAFSEILTLPDYLRSPTSLTLATLPDNNNDLRIEAGARITADPRATLAMRSSKNIFMDGTLVAKGGTIDLQITSEGEAQPIDPAQMIWLGSNAVLDAGATRTARYSSIGLLDGDIVDAGTVSLFARRGAIIAAPGSRIDVSGASFAQDYANVGGVECFLVAAAAGGVSFTAANGIAVFADLKGAASGDGRGGSLTYKLDANDRRGTLDDSLEFDPRSISVVDRLLDWDNALQFDNALPTAFNNRAIVAADTATKGGFTSLALVANNVANGTQLGSYGSIVFDADVQLGVRDTLVLGATTIELRDHKVALRAPLIQVGQQLDSGAFARPVEQQVKSADSGTGELQLYANFIELFGNISVGGTERVLLSSTNDIRLRAPAMLGGRFVASTFSTQGDLALQASQVYGSTLTDYTFSLLGADSTFSSTNSGAQRTPVLSAASKLTIEASHVDIGGTLLAPLGTIAIEGGKDVRLRDSARLDVSANNLLIPFGRIQGGDILWSYTIDPAHPLLIETAPEKSVAITGPSVAMDKGAQINVSGGGDIYGVEQIPGTGGSHDFLDPAYAGGAFAVVPWLNSSISPFDQVEQAGFQIDGKAPRIGDIIHLDGGAGLPAGDYAIMPAHYALLDGAYLVTPRAVDWRPGLRSTEIDGTVLVGGRYGRAFGGGYDGQARVFAIEPGSAARTRSEYKVTTGDQFFVEKPDSAHAADAGRVSFDVTEQLELLGSILGAAAQNGRRAQLDIIANEIEVVNVPTEHTTAVQLNAGALSSIGVDSVLLGGRRSGNGKATTIDVAANSVTVSDGAKLEVPDIILAARDRIAVDKGATIAATGASTAGVQQFKIEGDGALLRVSSAGQADVVRTNAAGSAGTVDIAAGATVFADRSILIDSTRDMRLDGAIGLKSRSDVVTSLNLTANRISLGDGSTDATEGLSFSNARLNSFNAQALRLSSRTGIDFYGDVVLNNSRVELNTGALRNMQPGDVQLRAADTLQLDNAIGATDTASAASDGKLVLAATSLVLGNGRDVDGKPIDNPAEHKMDLFGFAQVDLGAAGLTRELVGEGNFKLANGGNLDIIADRVGGIGGATTSIELTGGTLDLRAANAPASAGGSPKTITDIAAQLGAKLNLTADRIAQGTHIDLPSGIVTLRATGAGADDNVSLLAGSVTDVSGRKLVFPQGSVVASNGGAIRLYSTAGDVVGAAGAKVVLGGSGDFDGRTLGATGADNPNKVTLAGNAGMLDIVAKGRALWQSGIQALAGANPNGGQAQGGNLQLDVGSFETGGFSGWLQRIADSGIDQRVSIRSRSGDLMIDKNIRAADLAVSADSGDLTLAANIDARGGNGGHVALWGGGDLTLAAGARIDAQATAAGGRGGKIELGARDGTLAFGANTALAVAGQAGAAGEEAGRDGQVLLRAPRTAIDDGVEIVNDVAIVNDGVTISGAARIELEAFKSYEAIDGTVASVINDAFTDAQQFMGDEVVQDALRERFADAAPADRFHMLPGIDIFSTGDLTLDSNVNLSTRRYGAVPGKFDGEAGVLSLRAGNDLIIAADLRDGTIANPSINQRLKNSSTNVLRRDFSWNYRLVGGADLTAADPTATQRETGNVTVAGGKDIVTGAGWMGIYAGKGMDVQDANSVIAILGRSDYSSYKVPLKSSGNANKPDYESMPDTGSIDPYYLIAPNNRNDSGGLVSVGARYPFYPKDGGDLTLSAGSDVRFAESTSFFTDWIERIANNALTVGSTTGAQNIPIKTVDLTTWGVTVDTLTQGVAVLGGGNVSVRAGGDVVNLNAALPVTAKQVGNGVNQISIIGGGNLDIVAGGDILSPRLWVDRGQLTADAGGRFGAADGGLAPLLALADTQVDIQARGEVVIGAAFNSTMVPVSRKVHTTNGAAIDNYFFSYSSDASVAVSSLQGDVVFANDYKALQPAIGSSWVRTLSDDEATLFTVYPGQLSAIALNRDIRIEDNMTLFPSAIGQLVLLAGSGITLAEDATKNDLVKVNLSDTDPNGLPRFNTPVKKLYDIDNGDSPLARLRGALGNAPNPNIHAATPLHVNDANPAIIAALGDIAVDGNLVFELAKPVRAYAGNDISNVTFSILHSNASQISEIIAGRDVAFPLVPNAELGTIEEMTGHFISVEGPGRLDVIAGRDIDLGASNGIEAAANTRNPALPDQGATVNLLAGVKGANALNDPVLYAQFADRYFGSANTLGGSYIDWFASGAFTTSNGKVSVNRINLIGAFTGKTYTDDASALADFRSLPLLTQQAISLEAYQSIVTPHPLFQQPSDYASLLQLGGNLGAALKQATGQNYDASEFATVIPKLTPMQRQQIARTLQDAASYSARLIDFVSLESFGGDLTKAVAAATGQSYASNTLAAAALAQLPAAQQHAVARQALDQASVTVRRGFLIDVYSGTVLAGGAQQAMADDAGLLLQASEGYNRGFAAIEQMFPGKKWAGDVKLGLSAVRTFGDGDINVLVPGGAVDVGLPNKIAGFERKPSQLGIITNGYGAINGVAEGSFNVNQSRVFSLGNGDAMLWSSNGNVDAGKGAKTELSVEPPKTVFSSDGSSTLVYSVPVAGSGIQVGGPKQRAATNRGALLLQDDATPSVKSDTRLSRLRYVRSLSSGDSYLLAPHGTVNAGDAGISVDGNLLIAARTVLGADNINVGGISIGVPTTTSISASTLSLGDVASSATESATNSMNDAIRDTAAGLAEGGVAFVTVDIIGVGK
jgi:filamentous hemagglutinin family protein